MNESLQLCRALSSIRSLDLSRNNISCMEALCPSLEMLNLESNFIGTSHSSVSYEALKKLNMLTLLSMSGNRLTSIPYDMFDMMTQLQYLNLSNNFLTALDIFQFQHNSLLTLVDFSQNQLKRFETSSISNMTSLQYLYLDYNNISIFN